MMLKTQFSSKVDLSGFGNELFNFTCEVNILLTLPVVHHVQITLYMYPALSMDLLSQGIDALNLFKLHLS